MSSFLKFMESKRIRFIKSNRDDLEVCGMSHVSEKNLGFRVIT